MVWWKWWCNFPKELPCYFLSVENHNHINTLNAQYNMSATHQPKKGTTNSTRRSSARIRAREAIHSVTTSDCHRPTPGASATSNDCGILPSEWYRIAASVTPTVPWGFVCGYPTSKGDLYGGSHYMPLASSTMTPQGWAIKEVSIKFGDGRTLPFTPCKKGYIPAVRAEKRYACPLHHKQRLRRVTNEGGVFRTGEMDLEYFWKEDTDSVVDGVENTKTLTASHWL